MDSHGLKLRSWKVREPLRLSVLWSLGAGAAISSCDKLDSVCAKPLGGAVAALMESYALTGGYCRCAFQKQ